MRRAPSGRVEVSVGARRVYGLGSGNKNLPGFVSMSPRARPRGTLADWGSAFPPGADSGTDVNIAQMKPDAAVGHPRNPALESDAQRAAAGEQGVRAVQLSHPIDGHGIAKGRAVLAKARDQGIAARLTDVAGTVVKGVLKSPPRTTSFERTHP